MHRAVTNLPLESQKNGGSKCDGGTLIIVLLWCCFSELDRYLKPDKKRAEELCKEFQAGFDGIASRIWPNLRIVICVTTGMVAKCDVFVDATNHYSLATRKERAHKHCHCSVFTCLISRSSLQT